MYLPYAGDFKEQMYEIVDEIIFIFKVGICFRIDGKFHISCMNIKVNVYDNDDIIFIVIAFML